MTLGVSVYYLAATLIVLGLAWRKGGVTFDCAVALLIWYCLANATYSRGEVETIPTFIAAGIQLVVCGILTRKYDHHWLPLYLLFSAAAVILWTSLYDEHAYIYKSVKNGIFIGELLAVSLSIWTSHRTRSDIS